MLHQTAAGSTVASLPSTWVNTAEGTTAAGDGTTNGTTAVSVTTGNITNVNFGIEEPPTANTTTATSQTNPGGTTSANIQAATFGGTDASGGIISSIIITAFPTNATSITINGVVYTTLSAIQTAYPTGIPTNAAGQPTVPIAIDPIDGAVTVAISYVTVDNAGVQSATAGVANVPFTTATISGNVLNDVNGTTDAIINGTGTNIGATLYVSLVDATNAIITTVPVAANGSYSFANVNGGNYTVVLHQTAAGSTVASLPSTWVNTAEGTTAAGDGTTNGTTAISVTTGNVSDVNFGIEQPPVANTATAASQTNPGGTTSVTVPATTFGGTDASGGVISSIIITAFPTNATSISINGVVYTTLAAIQTAYPTGIPTNAAGQPTVPIAIDPIDGAVTVAISYVTVDNAGVQSTTAGVANVPFTEAVVPIKITNFTALPNGNKVNLQWVVSEQTGVDTYQVEVSVDGRIFATIATVNSNGNLTATYNAIHTNPVAGINYYRIKTVEKDGTISYSDLRRVNIGKGGDVIIYPNPVSTGVVNITLTGSVIGKTATISILSMDGKLISTHRIARVAQTETMDVNKLASGKYVVRIVTDNEVINKTIDVIK